MIDEISPNYGSSAGGNTITITGSGFDGTTTVEINELVGNTHWVAASCTLVSSTELECIMPPHSYGGGSGNIHGNRPVDVRVTTPAIGSEILSGGYTYIGSTIYSLTPDHGPTTGGNTVVIKGIGFVRTTTEVRYLYYDESHSLVQVPVTATSVSDTEVTVVMPAAPAGTGELRVGNGIDSPIGASYTYESVSLSLSVSPSDIGFTVAPGGGGGYGYAVATVETDSASGYKLTLESNGADLVCEDNAAYTIPSIATDGALTIASGKHGAWGWNVNTVSTEPTSWRTIPIGTPAQIANTNTPAATNGDDYNLYFGAVADNAQAACRYRQTLVVTATAN
jgi:hypothetical protein